MTKTRILIADDHALVRAGLRLLIESQKDLEVVGETGDLSATQEAAGNLRPDILTLDLGMPGGSCLKLIDRLLHEFPRMRILVLTMHDDPAYVRTALAAGAAGYVVKSAVDSQILRAIRTVQSGGVYAEIAFPDGTSLGCVKPVPAESRASQSALDALSEREREVFQWVARGYTSQAIAEKLFLSAKTVESYRARLMAKLGLRNRAELMHLALEVGLLDADPLPN